ncbi:MAG: VacJ family lipoprotein [Anaerolineae bacterium]|nr:VacJ family lipoprotein [Anaerolineae bacterium]
MSVSRCLLIVLLALPVGGAWGDQAREENIDPWEPLNRRLYAFNDTLDRLVLRPAARGYRFVMPDVAERGVGNFIANIYEVNSAFNSLLQGRIVGAAHSTGRFLINSTLGLAGLFDVASRLGIEPHRADFGQTLAVWGFEPGPFLMVPVLGPRTIRSGAGYLFDTYTSIPAYVDNSEASWGFWVLEVVDYRARLLQADELITGDRYIFVRDAYLAQREFFVNRGVVKDDFSNFEQEEGWEEF